jgi:hypothetical protein
MNSTRFHEAASKNPGVAAIEIFSENKADAQRAIKLAKAWLRANGRPCKLVSFTSAPRGLSNLDIVFRARIAYQTGA